MTCSTDYKIDIKEPLLDKIKEMSETAYTRNAYVGSEFHDIRYYNGYQRALMDVKEFNDVVYKTDSSSYFVADVWREKLFKLENQARDRHESECSAFRDKCFYQGYTAALKDLKELYNDL